ncbi:ABC transporter ATP-binding protein [Candidatus Kaiserbacteria bacterium]|nr:ABC transporter ATP-binding protein [Candidatus Kaiserbacteria bacterium]
MKAEPAHIYRQMLSILRLAMKAYRPYRTQIVVLTLLGFLSGILEGIGINAVIPLLSSALGMQNAATDSLSLLLKDFFAFIHVPFVPRYMLALIVILFIGKSAVMLLLTYIQAVITMEYERTTRSKLFGMVLSASWPYLLKQKLGNLETALMIDVPSATALLTKIVFSITLVTSLIMYLIVAFSISPVVTLSTIVLGLLTFVTLRPLMDRVHRASTLRTVVFRDTLHHVTEHVGGLKTVKAYGAEASAIQKGEGLFEEIRAHSLRIQMFQQVASQIVAPIGVIYIALILALAFKTPFITFAALPAVLYLIYRIFTYVQQMQNNLQYMSELAPHLSRIIEYEQTAQRSPEPSSGDAPFSFERALAFEHVTFSYESGREVLKDTSFEIKKGSMVGIVGPSGSGKTTTVDLILRLLLPTSGAVTLDGVDSRTIALDDWRRHIAYVSQELFLIQDTIRNNICFYDESVSDEDIWEAARLAHIDDFISRCKDGLETLVGERGIKLSAGERQRIVIARALARKPKLLILDEATSALDNEAEAHIKRVIEELKGHLTIIAIAHRLSTIMDSDELIVLKDGRVVETGAPSKLLADPASYFFKVYSINQ